MRGAYVTLFESVMSWYSKWYPGKTHQLIATSVAMAVMMLFNLYSLSYILAAAGQPAVSDFLAVTRVRSFGLFLLFTALNHSLGRRQLRQSSPPLPGVDVAPAPKKYAIAYFVSSILVYLASIVLAIVSDGI